MPMLKIMNAKGKYYITPPPKDRKEADGGKNE